MSSLNYALNQSDYSWTNALLWGNFIGHCKKVGEGKWEDRIVHLLIAASQLLPIISQIASIAEKCLVECFSSPNSANTETKPPLQDKSITVENKENKTNNTATEILGSPPLQNQQISHPLISTNTYASSEVRFNTDFHCSNTYTISIELLKEYPLLESFFMKKLKDETSPDIQNLKTLFKSFRFTTPIDFESISTFDCLMVALKIGGVSFQEKYTVTSIKTMQALDPVITSLYQNTELPLTLRETIKSGYLCTWYKLLKYSAHFFINHIGNEKRVSYINKIINIDDDPELISAQDVLQSITHLAEKKKNSNPLNNLNMITLYTEPSYSIAYEWFIAGMGFSTKSPKYINKMEVDIFEQIKPDYINCDMEQCLRNADNFTEKFKELFPEEDIEKYSIPSSKPSLFEIPLLAEALDAQITIFYLDATGHWSKHTQGPEETDRKLIIALQYPYQQMIRILNYSKEV